jgi:hypothetical protein
LLLLNGGHLLVAKQRDPIVVIEFGRRNESPKGLSGDAYLPVDRSFEPSDGSRTTLHALASWQLDAEAEATVESANDLALDDRARLHAVSSKSRSIYELDPASARNGRLSIAHLWQLPGGLQAGHDRRAEGLAFDDRGRPLVAVDAKDKEENTFLLEPARARQDVTRCRASGVFVRARRKRANPREANHGRSRRHGELGGH